MMTMFGMPMLRAFSWNAHVESFSSDCVATSLLTLKSTRVLRYVAKLVHLHQIACREHAMRDQLVSRSGL